MKILQLTLRNPFNFLSILLVYPPALAILVNVYFYGWKYWYLTLAAALFLLLVNKTLQEVPETWMQVEDRQIQSYVRKLGNHRIFLLESLGEPEVNGLWSDRQVLIWNQIKKLEQEEEDFLRCTEVVNLDPLGHNVGRIYKRSK